MHMRADGVGREWEVSARLGGRSVAREDGHFLLRYACWMVLDNRVGVWRTHPSCAIGLVEIFEGSWREVGFST